jgi:hypothetical protein
LKIRNLQFFFNKNRFLFFAFMWRLRSSICSVPLGRVGVGGVGGVGGGGVCFKRDGCDFGSVRLPLHSNLAFYDPVIPTPAPFRTFAATTDSTNLKRELPSDEEVRSFLSSPKVIPLSLHHAFSHIKFSTH